MAHIIESFPYSNYVVRKLIQSRIDPDYFHQTEVGVKCPHCKVQLMPLDHGERTKCMCGASLKRLGNSLTVEL